ncbi:MAG: aldehyde dehydrogenase family protein [Pseudomonadota bacterium]
MKHGTREFLYVDGGWQRPLGGGRRDVVDPSTGEVVAQVVEGDTRDAARAVAAARGAADAWARTAPAERAQYLRAIQAGLRERASALTEAIATEVGMPARMAAKVQVDGPLWHWGHFAELAERYAFSERVGHSVVDRAPVGVVAAITPWNFPLNQITLKVAPALAAGCTVVLKPSEIAPLNAYLLTEAIHAAGLPPGVFNLVPGTGPEVGEALATHPEVDMVSLTGSTRAGRRVMELAAGGIRRVALELGGKSASVVLPDADLAAAVKGTLSSCLLNSGQACSATTRLLVPRDRIGEVGALAQAVLDRLRVGSAHDADAALGPLVSLAQLQRVQGLVARALEQGARVLARAERMPEGHGFFARPMVLLVQPQSEIAREEVFGPVLCVMAYDDEEQAVRIANDSIYGLGGAVWSADTAHALAVARRLRTGQVDINGARWNPQAPFGGWRQSGLGRENGTYGLEEYLQTRSVQLPAGAQ